VSSLYIGLMSGTSLDGVDAVLVDFADDGPRVLGSSSLPFPAALRAELLALNTTGPDELHRAALAGNALARVYATATQDVLRKCKTLPKQIAAIGAHGQTVRHRPLEFDGTGYTLQLNQPALLAELCGIDVVADFRSRDVAAGGQGAPLVPPFHQSYFGHLPQPLAVLNIGGISNITLIDKQATKPLTGFDCGPGNALMDAWCELHTGAAFDAGGQWASQGHVVQPLLGRFLSDPYFAKIPPKSTGRDLFNWDWLQRHLAASNPVAWADVQATVTELTACACADAVPDTYNTLVVCGGGAFNLHLMHRLQARLPSVRVTTSSEFGLPPLQVEATAFAWLAHQTMQRKTSNAPNVTGAQGARILGCIYPA
jgi:anhydro-N-acetylmuramic acid kinase